MLWNHLLSNMFVESFFEVFVENVWTCLRNQKLGARACISPGGEARWLPLCDMRGFLRMHLRIALQIVGLDDGGNDQRQ